MIKLLRRTVIIRQYDYDHKVRGPAASLYDTSTFEPYLRTALEQDYIYRVLSNTMPEMTREQLSRDPEFDQAPYQLLRGQWDRLYNQKYVEANLEEDSDGRIWCWYRSNTPRSILGLATFEYSYAGLTINMN
jgi:hypothetical protein